MQKITKALPVLVISTFIGFLLNALLGGVATRTGNLFLAFCCGFSATLAYYTFIKDASIASKILWVVLGFMGMLGLGWMVLQVDELPQLFFRFSVFFTGTYLILLLRRNMSRNT